MARASRRSAAVPVPDRITVPDLEGAIVAAALRQAELTGFALVIADPPTDLASLRSSGWWVVASQEPPGGSLRFRGDTVVVTLRRDGGGDGAGDREPRRPVPPRLAARPPLDDSRDPDEAHRTGGEPGRTATVPEDATVLRFERPAHR